MMSLIGSYVGSLEEMHELMELVKAGKVPPIPVQTRPLSQRGNLLDETIVEHKRKTLFDTLVQQRPILDVERDFQELDVCAGFVVTC